MDDELPYFQLRPPKRRPLRDRGWIVGIAAGGVVIVLVLVVGVRAVLVRALCAQDPIRLHVAAALDVAPAVQRIGQYFNDLNRNVGGHCAQVEVTEDPSDAVAAELAGMSTIQGETPVDAWVPDSSLWVDVVRNSARGAAAVHPTGISVAKSPLVIAVPRKVARKVTKWSRHISWQTLFPQPLGGPPDSLGLQIQLPDPEHSAVGLSAVVEIRRLLGGKPTARNKFTTFVHNVTPTSSLEDPQALAAFTSLSEPPWNGRPVTVTSEQAVETYNQAGPHMPLTAFYPAQEYDLDYPFALTTSSPLKVQAARQFEKILRSSFAATFVRGSHFRSAGRQASQAGSQFGIVGSPQPAVALAAPGETSTALQAWKRLALGSRDLVINDVSDAMTQPLVPGGQTRLQVLQQAASLGLSLFPDSTEMAAWEYSNRLRGTLPYRVLVPMGALPQQLGLITRRQQLQEYTRTLTAQPGAAAALYSTILAGFRWMTSHYKPGHVNAEIVLGSGTDTARHEMSAAKMLASLRKDYNPQRPVEIITVTAGTQGDEATLREATAITHGQAYVVEQPSDIAHVFFDALARRICTPNCAGG